MLKKILLYLFIAYSILGIFILPFVLESQVPKILNEQTNSKLSIDNISFNPYIFKLELSGIELKDLDDKHLISFDSVAVDVEPHSLFRAAIHVKSIILDKPQISLVYNSDKTFNFSSIMKTKAESNEDVSEKESSDIPRVIIDKIAIESGGLDYEDYTNANKFEFSVDSIDFKLQDIDTNDFNSSGATLRFYSALGDGGEIDFRSKVLGFKPLSVEGSLHFKASKLYTQWRYIQDKLGLEVANGSLSFGADYFLNVDDLNDTRVDNLYVSLEKLRIKPKNKPQDILNLESLYIKNVSLKPMQKSLSVKDIDLNNLAVDFTIDEKGNLDWLEYISNVSVPKEKGIKENRYNLLVGSLNTGFDAKAFVSDDNLTTAFSVNNTDLKLSRFEFNSKTDSENIIEFESFDINDVNLNTNTKDILVSGIALNELGIHIRKDKLGVLNINGLKLAEKPKDEVENKKTDTKDDPFRVRLSKVSLNSAEIDFNDQSLQKKTINKLDNININAYNIDSIKNSWLDYDMSIRVNNSGKISSKGSVRHTPLKQKGDLELQRISLKALTPYLQENLHVDLVDGYLSLNSKLAYSKNQKKPDLRVDGRLKIEDIDLIDSRDKSRLVSFAKTELKSFNLEMFPNNLHIDEIGIDDFYVDAQIDENKQMNLAKLSKKTSDSNITEVKENNTTKEADEVFPIKIMKVHVSNGAATFADYSLPIKFKTSIHDLNGVVSAISNSKGEVSYIDIDGQIDKYGSTKIKGSLEASNIKSATDISVSFRNLALNSYSGYSAKFAGHKIENGKLFLDLGYKIQNSELLGSNSLVIKNMELGDSVDDENITQLPLGFAIALLEDSEGVIDIDMPVEGNMDEPDFKYGSLVMKTFANLILKAVASPFNFLGAAMGIDGDKLKYSDFEPSEYAILPPEKEKLDSIAEILMKKQKLSLEIIGSYDLELDKKAIQLDKLTQEVIKRSDDRIMTIDILQDIYEESVGDEIVDALKDELEKKHEDDDVYEREYKKELLARCTALESVSESELIDLSNKRSFLLKDYLVKSKNIDASRVISIGGQETENRDDKWVKTELKIVVK